MLKTTDPLPSEWMSLFKTAIESRDTEVISHIIHHLPIFETREQMEEFLLLSMDAEALLCDMRNELIDQRRSIQEKFCH